MDEKKRNPENTQGENEEAKVPLSILIGKAQGDLTMAILEIQNMYGLSVSIMDMVVSSALADIRSCVNRDLLSYIK